MLLGAYASLQWYGPGAAAMVADAAGTVAADITGTARTEAALAGSGTVSAAHVTGLKSSPALLAGSGTISGAMPRARARLLCDVQIGSRPSAEDVAWAVLDTSFVESGLTVRQALKLMAAAMAGKVTGAEGDTVRIRSAVADDKERIVAAVDGSGNRTAITVDLS